MNMMVHKKDTFHLSLISAFYFVSFSGIISCATVYLISKGFTSAEAGILLAISNLITIATQPILANYIDQHPNFQVKYALSGGAFLNLILLGLLFFMKDRFIIYCLFLLVTVIEISLQTFVNTLGVYYRNQNYYIDFGISRSMGSFGYSIAAYILGLMIGKMGGSMAVLLMSIIGTIVFLIASLTFRNNDLVEVNNEVKVSSKFIDFAKNNMRFIGVLVGIVFFLSAHMIFGTFTMQIIENVNGTSTDLGIALALIGFVEIPIMSQYSRISRKFKDSNLLIFSACMFFVKLLITMLATNVLMIFVACFFQSISYGLFLPSAVNYTAKVIEKKDAAKGQSLVGVATSIAGVLGCFAGGLILDYTSVHTLLITACGFAILGSVITFAFVDRKAC